MVVQHNIAALNSNRMLGLTTDTKVKSTEKLSSGYKINRAADDAAGLAISEKMRRQVRGLTQATSNCQDGISCVQTAEGALNEVHDMLQRMNELAVKAKNGTNQTYDREYIQSEMNQLSSEITRTATQTTFNKLQLLGSFKTTNYVTPGDGNKTWEFKLQVGTEASHTISVKLSSMTATSIGVGTDKIKVSGSESAKATILAIDNAIQSVSKLRSELGAIQNRLEHTITNLKNTVENTSAAESNVRDTDMATEMVKFANTNILAQAGQAMLSQANQNNQGVLSLLG